MPGSNSSIAGCNIVLNAVVADELKQFADVLETAADLPSALHAVIKDTIRNHRRIIFNGNGYDDAWITEAEKRGLLNLRTTPDALPYFIKEENIRLFVEQGIFSEEEIRSRYEILMEEYTKTLHIEARTMADIASKEILPSITRQLHEWSETLALKKQVIADADCRYEQDMIKRASALQGAAAVSLMKLKEAIQKAETLPLEEAAAFYRDVILHQMEELRNSCDELETITSPQYWPFPTYGKLLFGIL